MPLQVEIWGISCLLGIILGLIYDIFGIFRIAFRHKPHFMFLHDILYLIFTAILTFLFILYVNLGEVRLYILFGEAAGILCYYVTFSRIVNKLVFNTSNILINFSRRIGKLIFSPFINSVKFFKLICTKKRINVEKSNHITWKQNILLHLAV